jgi:hypothetical protein
MDPARQLHCGTFVSKRAPTSINPVCEIPLSGRLFINNPMEKLVHSAGGSSSEPSVPSDETKDRGWHDCVLGNL